MNIEYILAPVAAYLVGAIPFGLLIGKCYGIDVRKVGSGNIGATNVTRAVGKTAGKVCFFLDFLKGVLPVVLVLQLFPGEAWLALLVGLTTILGHMFPVFLKFRGGKGISTAAGVALALAPYPLLIAFAVWVAVFLTSRYVSLASIAAAVTVPTLAIVFACCGIGGVTATAPSTLVFFVAIGLLAIYRHRSNVRRLLNGTESRFDRKKKEDSE